MLNSTTTTEHWFNNNDIFGSYFFYYNCVVDGQYYTASVREEWMSADYCWNYTDGEKFEVLLKNLPHYHSVLHKFRTEVFYIRSAGTEIFQERRKFIGLNIKFSILFDEISTTNPRTTVSKTTRLRTVGWLSSETWRRQKLCSVVFIATVWPKKPPNTWHRVHFPWDNNRGMKRRTFIHVLQRLEMPGSNLYFPTRLYLTGITLPLWGPRWHSGQGAVLQVGRPLVRSQLVSLEFFIDIKSFRSHYGPGVESASNINEHQEYFLGVKADDA